MQQNQDKRPAHVRSASQGYHEIWNSAPFVCGKTWPCLKKKVAWRKFSIHSLQVESIFPVAHNEEKVKRTSLCFLCFYVKMDVFRSQYAKMNVFAKPNEQCRACSNIVMARKRTFRWTGKERLTRSLIHSSTCQLVHSSTRQLVNSSTRPLANLSTPQLVNLPNIVSFSAGNLTLWVPFLSTNCSPCRKKSILAKVCFDAK